MSKQKKRIHDTTNDLFMNLMQEARKAGVLKPLDEIKDYELPNENEFYNSDALCLTDYSFNVLFTWRPSITRSAHILHWAGCLQPSLKQTSCHLALHERASRRISKIHSVFFGNFVSVFLGRAHRSNFRPMRPLLWAAPREVLSSFPVQYV